MSTETSKDKDEALKGTAILPTIRKASTAHITLYALAVTCSAAAGTVLPIMTLIFGRFVTIFNGYALGSISNDEMMRQISHYTLYFVYLFIAKAALGYIAMMLFTHLATRATSSLQKRYLKSILRKPMAFHDTQIQSGAVVEALGTHTNALRSGLSDKMALSVQHAATVIAAFAIGISTIWNLALAVAAGIPATVVIIGCLSVFDDKQERAIRGLTEQASTIAHEVLASVKTVRSLKAEAKFTARYQSLLKQGTKIGWRRALIYGLLVATYMFILYGGYALAFWYGIRLYALGSVSEPGKVITTLFSIMIGMNSFSQLASFLGGVVNTITSAKTLIAAIDDQLDQVDEEELNDKGLTVPANGDIVLSNISFRYPARPTAQVLDGLSLAIARGKRTALVGPTGCGKSTITALLLKLYEAESGSIIIGDVPLTHIGAKNLRSSVGLVQQEPRLFTGTVAENVELGLLSTDLQHLSANEKRSLVVESCKMTQIHDFIESLPQGYDTHLGDSARQLSGGQKQRIAIARAIVKNPDILVLDEATSALDTKSEALIQGVLERAGKNRTVVAIAHRLSTIKDYDSIVVLKGGKVLEQGTHDELLEVSEGMYKNMWHIQSLYSNQEEQQVAVVSSDATSRTRQASSQATDEPGVSFKDEEQNAQLKPTKAGTARTVFSILSRHRSLWYAYAGLVISSVIAGGLYAAQAILYAKSVNAFQLPQAEQLHQANFWGLIWFIVCLIVAAGYYGLTFLGSGLGQTVSEEYRSSYFTSFLSQPCSVLDRPDNSVVKMTARLSSKPDAVRDLAGGNLSVIVTVGVSILSTTILALTSGWKYALVVLAAGLPTIFVANWFHERLENSFQERADAIFIDCVGFAGECVAGIRTVAALNMEGYVSRRFGTLIDEHCARAKKYVIRTMFLFSLSESIDLLVMALAFWYGGWLLVHDHYNTEQFFVVFVAIVFGAQSAGSYFAHSSEIAKGVAAARDIDDACASVGRLGQSSSVLEEVNDEAGDHVPLFECRHVNFAYPERPECPALVDFNIRMHPGQFIAFVGESGSGKSTITQLLERFYDVDSGTVHISGQPVSGISTDSLRSNFSMVSQEPVLYQGTIRDNLLLGVDAVPSQDVIDACLDVCQLKDLIASLPEGDLTQVGTCGSTLSGGQKQRLAIARAVLRDSPVLLLDEATSALDSETEHLIQRRLVDNFLASKRCRRGIVAIAHRLSTIRHADLIYVMKEGRIIESGSHDELCTLGGLYHSMWTAGDQSAQRM